MHYELIMTRTSVRLYEGWIHQMRGFSQQLCIMNMNYEFNSPRHWEKQKKDAIARVFLL